MNEKDDQEKEQDKEEVSAVDSIYDKDFIQSEFAKNVLIGI